MGHRRRDRSERQAQGGAPGAWRSLLERAWIGRLRGQRDGCVGTFAATREFQTTGISLESVGYGGACVRPREFHELELSGADWGGLLGRRASGASVPGERPFRLEEPAGVELRQELRQVVAQGYVLDLALQGTDLRLVREAQVEMQLEEFKAELEARTET